MRRATGPRVARAAVLLSTSAAAVAVVQVLGCDEPAHLLTGRYYVEARDCLGTSSSLDVVSGEDPGTCPPTCIVQRSYDGGLPVYVTATCPPYAVDMDATGADPRCARALAAFARGDTCLTDGGSTRPVADAGAD